MISSLVSKDQNIMNQEDGLIHDEEEIEQAEESKQTEENKSTMFSAFKRLISWNDENDDKYNQLKVTDPDFWP